MSCGVSQGARKDRALARAPSDRAPWLQGWASFVVVRPRWTRRSKAERHEAERPPGHYDATVGHWMRS